MLYLIFGDGLIGVETTPCARPTVCLSRLDDALEIGAKCNDVVSQPVAKLTFKNKEGLDVLINALRICRDCLEEVREVPPELRFGA